MVAGGGEGVVRGGGRGGRMTYGAEDGDLAWVGVDLFDHEGGGGVSLR